MMENELKILVVDDQEIMRRSIRRILRGHRVWEAGDGREAMGVVRGDPTFDVILSDMEMQPGMGGMEFYEALRTYSVELARRVIFVTGSRSFEVQNFCNRNLCPRVEKPFSREELSYAISVIVGVR